MVYGGANALAAYFRTLYLLGRPQNLLPSLHVAFSAIIVGALWPPTPKAGRIVLMAWLVLICLSVILVHQHHIADVIGGLTLALMSSRAMARTRTRR